MSKSGMSMSQISEQVGYAPSTVQRYMQMANGGNLTFEGKKTHSHKGKEWYDLKQKGMSAIDIAIKYKVSLSTVNKWIRVHKKYERERK